MLPKKHRTDKKTVEKIFKEGKFINSPSLTFKFIPNTGVPRISFIVPKNVAKLAVERNSLRRTGYTILQKYLDKFPTISGVFVYKKYEKDISKLENEITEILRRIN